MSLFCLRLSSATNLLRNYVKLQQLASCCSSMGVPAHRYCTKSKNINASTSAAAASAPTTLWSTVYRLPLIRLAASFNRLKIYQGALTTLLVPAAFAMELSGQLPENASIVAASIGVSGIVTLSLCSLALRNLVGFIYVNDTGDEIKLAYVDFWGKRRDAIVKVDDLVPGWEEKKFPKLNFYQTIQLSSDKNQKYKLLLRFGVVEDVEMFSSLFGDDW